MKSLEKFKNEIIKLSKTRKARFGSFGEFLVSSFYKSNTKNKIKSIRGEGVLADFDINGRKVDAKSTARILDKKYANAKIPCYKSKRKKDVEYEQIFFLQDQVVLINDFVDSNEYKCLKHWDWNEILQLYSLWSEKANRETTPENVAKNKKFGDLKKLEINNWYKNKTNTNRIRPFYRGPHNSLWSKKDQPDNGFPSSPDDHDFSVFLQITDAQEVQFIIAFPHDSKTLNKIIPRANRSKRQKNKDIEIVTDFNKMESDERFKLYKFKNIDELMSELLNRFPEYLKIKAVQNI